jgi:ABC-type multidrug transport system ATPase subunit
MAHILAKDISYSRGDRVIFSHIDFSIEPWEMVLIKGPSGSWKTTLLKVLWWLVDESSGKIDRSFSKKDRIKMCGFHFVEGPFLEYLSVEENLLILEIFTGISISRDYLNALCQRFEISWLLSRKIAALSSWQRERVSLIRAFLHHPEIVFLDEPGSNLDQEMGEKVQAFLREELKQWRSLILSTHENNWAKYAKNTILLPLYEA